MAVGHKTGGRTKGTPNKLTGDVRAMILGALNTVGGEAYLARQAEENPGAFMTLLGKVLPTQVTGKEGRDLLPEGAASPDRLAQALLAVFGGGQAIVGALPGDGMASTSKDQPVAPALTHVPDQPTYQTSPAASPIQEQCDFPGRMP